jgi:hypothetical protein
MLPPTVASKIAKFRFYECSPLDCGLYYAGDRRGPVHRYDVYVPRLDISVPINYLGTGQEAYDTLVDKYGYVPVFPVDLFHSPYVLDPKPSRTVTEDLYQQWESLMEYYEVMVLKRVQ